jgi:hypothetical protein
MVDKTNKCSPVTQAKNIERAGGAIALIIDDSNRDVREKHLSDDGRGAGIRIPVLLISSS